MGLSTSELIKIGLLQGLPLVVLVGAYHLIRSWWRKQNQKKHLRKIISTHVKKIREAKDTPDPDPKSKVIYKASEVRKSHYDVMYKQIDDLLSHKAVLIDYEDEELIRRAFYYINRLNEKNKFFGYYEVLLDLEVYEERLIKHLKKIKWLQLEKPEHPLPFMR
ncbi:MAG: hypothetical protein F4X55_02385 [Candidatus Dadabacteria bacterium]|nr:hypothetical protein [Candidatus Dadabacteria bacterium]